MKYTSMWQTIGGSSRDISRRKVGWSFFARNGGWNHHIENFVEPFYQQGMRRLFLRSPGGDDGAWPLDWAAMTRARMLGVPQLKAKRFVTAWKPYVESRPDLEVVHYCGSLIHDPLMERYAAENPSKWLWWLQEGLRPALKCGMSVALDQGGIFPADSLAGKSLPLIRQAVESYGRRLYIEPHPHESETHLHGYHKVVTEEHWDKAWKKQSAKPLYRNEVVLIRTREGLPRDDVDGVAITTGLWREHYNNL